MISEDDYKTIVKDVERIALHFHHRDSDKDIESPGVLIVLEGADGAGKSTIAKLLVDSLKDVSVQAVYMRTPGGNPLSEKLREILLHTDMFIHPKAEAYMFQAQLAQCISETIKPLLDAGNVVVCDRLVLSTLAYQGVGRGMDVGWLNTLQDWSLQGVWPDSIILLDNHREHTLDKNDRMEAAGQEFQHRVKTFYKQLILQKVAPDLIHHVIVEEEPMKTMENVANALHPIVERIVTTAKENQ